MPGFLHAVCQSLRPPGRYPNRRHSSAWPATNRYARQLHPACKGSYSHSPFQCRVHRFAGHLGHRSRPGVLSGPRRVLLLPCQSGCLPKGVPVSADVGVIEEGAVNNVGESPSQYAYGFGAGVARFLASLNVGAGIGMVVGLSDRDAGAGEAMWPGAAAAYPLQTPRQRRANRYQPRSAQEASSAAAAPPRASAPTEAPSTPGAAPEKGHPAGRRRRPRPLLLLQALRPRGRLRPPRMWRERQVHSLRLSETSGGARFRIL